ncbi:hypothetical protein, partial [Streptomyces sp. NPDC019937]|uniref:hypothetical protein n=1 Tax=Streptomyces sp. NPDC019937 TaxID=3154787 RepID=UPI00340503C3
LALTFGTLLSSQGTDASFETVSPVSPGFSLRAFQPFGFPAFRVSNLTRSVFRSVSGSNSVSGGLLAAFAFRRVFDFSRVASADLIGFAITYGVKVLRRNCLHGRSGSDANGCRATYHAAHRNR